MSTPLKKLLIAQVGCGYWGPNLLRNLLSIPECEVRFVVEQNPDRRQFIKRQCADIDVSTPLEDVLRSNVDAVVIATPAHTHFELAKQCLEAGKHIFVEKPLATKADHVDELERIASKKDVVLMAGHTFIYNPAVQYLKKYIDSGDLGDVYYAYSQRLNLGIVRSDVNVVWNLAPHDISILCYLFDGGPIAVQSKRQNYLQNKIDDVAFIDMTFSGNRHGHVHVSWLDPNKVRRMTVVGSERMIVYDDIAQYKITIYDKKINGPDPHNMPFDKQHNQWTPRFGDIVSPYFSWEEPVLVEMKHFIESIQKKVEPMTGVAHAREVVRALEMANIDKPVVGDPLWERYATL